MKKLVMSAAILASLAAPAFANSYHGTWNQPASPEEIQAPRTQAYAPGDYYTARAYAPGGFGYSARAYAPGPYSSDNEHAGMMSPSSPDYAPDYNR
jgi:hypothetical protein